MYALYRKWGGIFKTSAFDSIDVNPGRMRRMGETAMKTKIMYALKRRRRRGIAMIAALIFITLFSALSVGFLSMTSGNVQMASNHHQANAAFNAALSGLECAKYIAATTPTIYTGYNYVTASESDQIWDNLCSRLATVRLGNRSVSSVRTFEDTTGSGEEIATTDIPYGSGGAWFRLRFYRYDATPLTIHIQSIGQEGQLSRTVHQEMDITKDSEVLNYAIAGRGRMWITGDTTIHGDIYSSWDRTDISPFNMTSDSVVEGSVNTCMAWQDIMEQGSFQMQTYEHDSSGRLVLNDGKSVTSGGTLVHDNGNTIYDAYGRAIDVFDCDFASVDGEYSVVLDSSGNPVQGYVRNEAGMWMSIGEVTYGNPVEAYNADGSRVVSSSDELKGQYETANYAQPDQDNIPGLSISDYDTSMYSNPGGTIYGSSSPSRYYGELDSFSASDSGRKYRYEYFPHNQGSYTSGSGLRLKRYIYKDQTFSNQRLPANRNAVFINCTFNDVFYIDCSQSTSSYYNNVRFEDCNFNGVIVTNTPNQLSWQRNALYFTGSATFNNTSSIQEATILAPHFNVNLGDANNGNVQDNAENVIKGAVVGGIVDVRGNATIEGTIISMCDTSQWSSGFVTNIGATLDDGGSETVSIEDVGTITITPRPDEMLPSGIRTPVKIQPDKGTYAEVI